MDIAGGGGFGGVDIGMGVEPDDADFLILAAKELRYAGDGAGSEGVISAEDEGSHSILKALNDGFGSVGAGIGNLGEIAGIGGAGALGFGDFYADVATVGDLVAEFFEMGFKPGNTDGGRAHIDATAACAEIERNAKDVNPVWGLGIGLNRPSGSL
jgi:hypothetical protein